MSQFQSTNFGAPCILFDGDLLTLLTLHYESNSMNSSNSMKELFKNSNNFCFVDCVKNKHHFDEIANVFVLGGTNRNRDTLIKCLVRTLSSCSFICTTLMSLKYLKELLEFAKINK